MTNTKGTFKLSKQDVSSRILSVNWTILDHDISCPPVGIDGSNIWMDKSDL